MRTLMQRGGRKSLRGALRGGEGRGDVVREGEVRRMLGEGEDEVGEEEGTMQGEGGDVEGRGLSLRCLRDQRGWDCLKSPPSRVSIESRSSDEGATVSSTWIDLNPSQHLSHRYRKLPPTRRFTPRMARMA
jgi:hypothetical protein